LREVIVNALNNLFLDFVKWGVKEDGIYYPLNIDTYIRKVGTIPLPSLPGLPETDLAHVSLGKLAHILDQHYKHPAWAFSGEAEQRENTVISERLLVSSGTPPVVAFLTLLITQRRHAYIKQHITFSSKEQALLQEGGKDRLSTTYLFQWFEERIERDEPAIEAFAQMIKEMIIAQHIKIALGKLPYDTFRFYDDADGLCFAPDQSIEMSSISVRFDAVSEALYELGLIQASLTKPSHAPTQYGREVFDV
jgi:hypothetical protein